MSWIHPQKRVTIGKKGFIFLNGASDDALNGILELTCIRAHTEEAASALKRALMPLAKYAEPRGIAVDVVLVPTPATLYGDFLPSSVPKKYRTACRERTAGYTPLLKLEQRSPVNFLFPFLEMKELRLDEGFFPKGNWHPTGLSLKIIRDAYLRGLGVNVEVKDKQLVVVRRIVFQDKPTGTVVIRSDLEELKHRLIQFGVLGLLVLAASLLTVVMLSSVLRRIIAEPIVSLASTAKVFSREKDYSIRTAASSSRDEIGVLIEAFNEMLDQIQQRDVEVRQLNEGLERRVMERTIQLEGVNKELEGQLAARHQFESAMQEKNIELENANRAKDSFLASMSHELRTPLNAIIGFTGTLLMKLPGPLTEEQAKQLRTVQSSARHLLQLINDVLDLVDDI